MYEHLISLGPYGWVHCRKIDIEADGPLAFMLRTSGKNLRRKKDGRN